MASSRRIGTNENISTFGGATRTYTSFATWESATDNDLVATTTSEILECYADSASYNQTVVIAGAVTDASYFRIIRPASGQKHSGTYATGFRITYTSDPGTGMSIQEGYYSVQDIVFTCSASINDGYAHSGMIFGTNSENADVVGCIFKDMTNAGSGSMIAIHMARKNTKAINCIVHDSKTGIYGNPGGGNSLNILNCVAVNCTTAGIIGSSFGTVYTKGCGGSNNGANFTYCTQSNCSSTTPTFVDAANKDFHLSRVDVTWAEADTDTASWHAGVGYDDDIDGHTRPYGVKWDIGFDEVPGTTVKGDDGWKPKIRRS